MDERQGKLLRDSPFGTLKEVQRFIEWFRQPGQIVSAWDQHKYAVALEIMGETNGEA